MSRIISSIPKMHCQDRMTLESDLDTEKELLRLLPVQTQVNLAIFDHVLDDVRRII